MLHGILFLQFGDQVKQRHVQIWFIRLVRCGRVFFRNFPQKGSIIVEKSRHKFVNYFDVCVRFWCVDRNIKTLYLLDLEMMVSR